MGLSKGMSLKGGSSGLTKVPSVFTVKPKAVEKPSTAPPVPIGGYNISRVADAGSYQGASHPDMNFDGGLDTYGGASAEAGQTTTTS